MKKTIGFVALVVVFAVTAAASARIAGIGFPLAIVLLAGGALAAGFAASVRDAVQKGGGDTHAVGRGAGIALRILIGAFVIACMVAGGLWLIGQSA